MRDPLKARLYAVPAAVAWATAAPAYAQGVKIDSDTFGGLEARAIGPAAMSGRITAIDAVGRRPPHHLRGRRGRRALEVDGRRPARSRPSSTSTTSRSAPSRSTRPNPKTVWVGHRRDLGAQQRVGRRRRLQDAPTAATTGPGSASTRPSASRASSSTRRTRNTVFVCATGPPVRRPPRPRRLPHEGRRQDLGEGALRRRRHRLRRPRHGPAGPPASSTPGCGSSGAGRGSSPRAGRAAASTSRRTAARPGSRLDEGPARRATSGASRWPWRRSKPERRLRDGRGEEDTRSTAPTTWARPGPS